jgi:hypothetical protein
MTLAGMRLLGPWDLLWTAYYSSSQGKAQNQKALLAAFVKWQKAAENALERIRRRIAAIEAKAVPAPKTEAERGTPGWQWLSARADSMAVFAIEARCVDLVQAAFQVTRRSLLMAREENEQLRSELDRVTRWTQDHAADLEIEFPETRILIDSAEAQANGWFREILERAGAPLSVALEQYAVDARKSAADEFRRVGQVNTAIVRDLERVREVIEFARHSEAGGRREIILAEAQANSLTLLEHRAESAVLDLAPLDRVLSRSVLGLIESARIALRHGQTRAFLRATAAGWSRILRETAATLRVETRRALRKSISLAAEKRARLQERMGLTAPLWRHVEPVRVRSDLRAILHLTPTRHDLPLIYRRLFRLDAVTDPRFLIGRAQEMAALSSAYERWMGGRGTVVLITGARGSGKTSFLNCAEKAIFHSAPVHRLEFRERIRHVDQLRSFIAQALGAPNSELLELELARQRRVVVIEEFERIYLRVPGGFEAARNFLDLVESSARTTMWILALSQAAYSLLDGRLGLGRLASHQINTITSRGEILKRAILQRHDLSGLRLRFAAPPAEDPRVNRLRRSLGLERSASELFFEALQRESLGIFRAAFELWQESVERVEGGVLFMRQPLRPRYDKLRGEIDLDDTFRLHAIAQHGSLTAAELADVFEEDELGCRRKLERLHDLQLIELEPERPGFRIRPQAIRLALEILRGQNLE